MPRAAKTKRRAFTMVELLVTITVFAILASMVLFASQGVLQSSKRYRTKATIAKINAQLMEKWDAFASRRVPSMTGGNPTVRASQRLWAIREIQRMEMPQNYWDILTPPQMLPSNGGLLGRPALNRIYFGYIRTKSAMSDPPTTANFNQVETQFGQFASAECLWMIVTFGMGDEDGGTKQFRADEVGDKDEDGIPEFHDAWGNPISFLRWAPGFSNDWDTKGTNTVPLQGAGSSLINIDRADALDPLQLERRNQLRSPNSTSDYPGPARAAFALTPVVYSSGPDGLSGIINTPDSTKAIQIYQANINDPYVYWDGSQLTNGPYGDPDDHPGMLGRPTHNASNVATGEHLDNIHSHALVPN